MLYTVVIKPSEDGGYEAYVPAAKGCSSQGDTLRDARANIRDALWGWLASCRSHGESPPKDRRPGRVSKSVRVIRIRVATT